MKQSQQSSCKTSDKLASVLGVSHEKWFPFTIVT
jgi:hypothetical protein